jgi:hypothetical protein
LVENTSNPFIRYSAGLILKMGECAVKSVEIGPVEIKLSYLPEFIHVRYCSGLTTLISPPPIIFYDPQAPPPSISQKYYVMFLTYPVKSLITFCVFKDVNDHLD